MSFSQVLSTQQVQKRAVSPPALDTDLTIHPVLQVNSLVVTLDIPSSSPYIHSHSQCLGLDLHHLSWTVRASQHPLQLVLNCRLLAKQEQREIKVSIRKMSTQREG